MARPSDYSNEILIKAQEYLDSCEDAYEAALVEYDNDDNIVKSKIRLKVKLPSIEGLALYLNIARSTLYLWKDEYEEFSDIIEHLQQKQAQMLINSGLSGVYNPTITKVLLTKHGYREGQELSGVDGEPLQEGLSPEQKAKLDKLFENDSQTSPTESN